MARPRDGGVGSLAAEQMISLAEFRQRSESLSGKVEKLDGCRAHFQEVTQAAELEAAQCSRTSVKHLEALLGNLRDELVQAKCEQILLRSLGPGQLEILDGTESHEDDNEDRQTQEAEKLTHEIEQSIAEICSGFKRFEEDQRNLHSISCDEEIAILEELEEAVKASTSVQEEYESAMRRLTETSNRLREVEAELAADEKHTKLAEAELERFQRQLRERQHIQQDHQQMAAQQDRLTAMDKLVARYTGFTVTDMADAHLKFTMTNLSHAVQSRGHTPENLGPQRDLDIRLDPRSMELLSAKLTPEFCIAQDVSAAKLQPVYSSGLSRMDGERYLNLAQVECLVREVWEHIHSYDVKASVVYAAAQSSRYAFRLLEPHYISATIFGSVQVLLEVPNSWPAAGVPLSVSSLLPGGASLNLSSTSILHVLEVCNSLEKSVRCHLVRFAESLEKIIEGMKCRETMFKLLGVSASPPDNGR